MNNKKLYKTIAERGGLMIEALAMLGLIAVVTPTMYKKSAERTLEVEDINTAGVMRTYMGALDAYIAANYADLMDKNRYPDSGGAMTVIPVNAADLVKYLPYNYDTTQSLYEFTAPTFKVVRRSNNLTAFALFPAKSAASNGIGQERTARIAALVGSNGGYVTNSTNNLNAVKARGVGGIWKLEDANYATVFNGESAPKQYSIVISSSNVVNGDALGEDGDQTKYLQRTKEEGEDQEWRNTMRTDLYLGGKTTGDLDDDEDEDLHSIRNVNSMIIGAEKVTDGDDNELNYGLFINKTGTNPNAFIGGTLEAAFNEANNKARFLVSDGDIDMNEHVKTDNISGLYSTAPGEITVSVDGKVRVNEELIAKQVDTGKVRATELAVGSDKIDSGEKWLNVDTSGVQISEPDVVDGKVKFIASSEQIKLTTDAANSGDNPTGGAVILMNGNGNNPKDNANILMAARDVYAKVTAGENGDEISEIDAGRFTVGKENSDVLVVDVKSGTTTNPSYSSNKWKLSKYPADSGTVFVRKGMLAVTGDKTDRERNPLSTVTVDPTSAEQGTGIVMANRFVANNLDKDGNLVKVPDLLTSDERSLYGTGSNRYDTYMVNPAYTSVMNDIKLTTRGGARLSDILPDFITKGIYVATNSKSEGKISLPSNLDGQDSLNLLTGEDGYHGVENNYASPLTGYVPAPQCPPGYSRVITVTPSSFQMAQAGQISTTSSNPAVTNVYKSNEGSGGATNLIAPSFDTMAVNAVRLNSNIKGKLSVTGASISDSAAGLSATDANITATGTSTAATLTPTSTYRKLVSALTTNLNAYVIQYDDTYAGVKTKLKPFVFQQSTWLKTLALPIKKSDYTQGWAVLMGFLYPKGEYARFINSLTHNEATLGSDDDSDNNKAYWNIFPVKKDTLEAYVTTYCYFDRGNGFGGFKGDKNDPSQGVKDAIGDFNALTFKSSYAPADAAYRQNLNDPSLEYDELW